MKVSRTVRRRGKAGDNIKGLPIPIVRLCGDAHYSQSRPYAQQKHLLYGSDPCKERSVLGWTEGYTDGGDP